MKRGLLLKLLRMFAGKNQVDVAIEFGADQSTISRIEHDDMYVTPEMQIRLIDACGGPQVLKTILTGIQNLLDQYDVHRLLPA